MEINQNVIESDTRDNWILDNPKLENNISPEYTRQLFKSLVSNINAISRIESNSIYKSQLEFNHSNTGILNVFMGKASVFRNTEIKDTFKRSYFTNSHKWLGLVVSINEKTFQAKLEDSSNQGTHEYGEFEKSDVSKEDLELLTVGAVFYWSVGKEYRNGQITKESIIRFQRLPNWSVKEHDEAVDKARLLSNRLKWV